MEAENNKNKTIVITITALIAAAGLFSAARFTAALYALFSADGGVSAHGFLSLFGVSEKSLSAIGVFYLAAALLSFSDKRSRAFTMLAYTAWAQLTSFAVCFMIFGIFCGPRATLPHLAIAAAAVTIVSLSNFRRAFNSDTDIFKKQYKLALIALSCVVVVHCIFIGYFALNYPHLFTAPSPTVDFGLSAPGIAAADGRFVQAAGGSSSDTTEIFGFKLALPPGFQLSKTVHEKASKNTGTYDKAIYSCGSDQIMLTTKNGILIEQLYSMTAIFDIAGSYDFYSKYINDRFGAVWLSSKSFMRYDYAPFTAGRWHGYIETGPFLSNGRYFAKSFNLWSRDPACDARAEFTFFFKNGGPPDALIKALLASLEVCR